LQRRTRALKGVPGSGSAVTFANDIYQVSYNTLEAIEESSISDVIKLCLIELPENCPPGDNRGKVYGAMDLKTDFIWFLADSEHACGGA
jgi:hypothetical protein